MPYWLSLLADLADRDGRPDDARATLDAAAAGARARDDLCWLPEVLRMRAAYDDREQALARLRAAARLATEHGSVALVRRCQHDLAALGALPARRSARERGRHPRGCRPRRRRSADDGQWMCDPPLTS
jgi:hypothetical protein